MRELLVVGGHAGSALLDSYEAERIPVARRLLTSTDRAFTLVVSNSWIAGPFRTRILAKIAGFAMTFERTRPLAFRTLSQTGVAYRTSPVSRMLPGVPGGAPRAGDRFPWLRLRFQANGAIEDLFQKVDDARYSLIAIGQSAPSAEALGLGSLLSVHVIPNDPANVRELAGVHITSPALYLLRAIRRYLSATGVPVAGREPHLSHGLAHA